MAVVRIDPSRSRGRVNRLVLGNNIPWNNRAEQLLDGDSGQIAPRMLEAITRLAPTVLRYPGGTNADTYHWKAGVGATASRGTCRTLTGSEEKVLFGTDELLDLSHRFGAEAMFTVNVATGTPAEAAEWVAYVKSWAVDPRGVRYWEIGNEPYLEAHLPEARMTPAEYARRANAFIHAMKAVDPSIQVGVPLRSDFIGGVTATPFPGFNETVLRALTEPFEFVVLHSAYFPVTFEKKETPREMYLATMAGTRTLLDDLAATRLLLGRLRPGSSIRLAVTEYNALYSLDILRLGLLSLVTSRTDRYIESLAGALYAADALMVFAQTPDLLMANFWSLSGNWYFGAIDQKGNPRPQFDVLETFGQVLRGELLPVEVEAPVLATPRVGFAAARSDLPQVSALAVADGGAVRLLLLNKHPEAAVEIRLLAKDMPGARTVAWRELNGPKVFERTVQWHAGTATMRDGETRLHPGPHSLTLVEIPLRRPLSVPAAESEGRGRRPVPGGAATP